MALSGNATKYAQNAGGTLDQILAARVIQSFYEGAVAAAFANLATFASNSNVVQWEVDAAVSSAAVAEGSAATPAQWSSTAKTATMGKRKVVFEVSDEAMVAGGLSVPKLRPEQFNALVEGVETDLLDLASGFSGSVGTTNTAMEPADVFQAVSIMRESKIPGPYKGILSPKSVFQNQQAIISSAAPVWSQANETTILGGLAPAPGSYVGRMGSTDLYTSTQVEVSAPDDLNLIFSPQFAYGLAVASTLPGGFKFGVERGKSGALDGGDYIEMSIFFAVTELVDAAGIQALSVS